MFFYGIALTGGIATGKSTVADMLRMRGYEVVDADKIAHEVLEERRVEVVQKFGCEILNGDVICRKRLGAIIFGDAERRKILEEIVLPHVNTRILAKAGELEARRSPYFLDIPLFFEQGGRSEYDIHFVVVVYATEELQLVRLKQRNNLTEGEAQQRIDAQISIESKRAQSDFIIENMGSLAVLERNLKMFLRYIAQFYGQKC